MVLRVFVMRSFAELERRDTFENLGRVVNAITERTDGINSKASDWAAWDDAYQFVQDGNSHFIRSNFVLSAFTGINLNLIAYLHNSGEIAYARWHYPGAGRLSRYPRTCAGPSPEKACSSAIETCTVRSAGILMLEQGPMLVASRPVLTSNEEGPIRGSLIFGQLLDSEEVQSLSRITRVPVVIERLDAGSLPADFARVADPHFEERTSDRGSDQQDTLWPDTRCSTTSTASPP